MSPSDSISLPELKLFPAENFRKESIKLYLKNGFSFDKLNQVVAANYVMSANTTMAFVCIQKNPEEAQSLASDYYDFLIKMGGKKVESADTPVPGLKIVDLLGDYDMVFSDKGVLAGIHQAKNLEVGKSVADKLYQKINQSSK